MPEDCALFLQDVYHTSAPTRFCVEQLRRMAAGAERGRGWSRQRHVTISSPLLTMMRTGLSIRIPTYFHVVASVVSVHTNHRALQSQSHVRMACLSPPASP